MAERARFPAVGGESEAETERRFARWANRASLRESRQSAKDRGSTGMPAKTNQDRPPAVSIVTLVLLDG